MAARLGVDEASRSRLPISSPAAQMAANGKFSQNTRRQPPMETAAAARVAPYKGPKTLPASWSADTEPRAKVRPLFRYRSAASARESGTNPPPPRPCKIRPATSHGRPAKLHRPLVAV